VRVKYALKELIHDYIWRGFDEMSRRLVGLQIGFLIFYLNGCGGNSTSFLPIINTNNFRLLIYRFIWIPPTRTELVIDATGRARLENVTLTEIQNKEIQLTQQELSELFKILNENKFWALKEFYYCKDCPADSGTRIIILKIDSNQKIVTIYGIVKEVEKIISFLENIIQKMNGI